MNLIYKKNQFIKTHFVLVTFLVLLVSSLFITQSFAQDRINIKSRGFSIVPPEGWKIKSSQSQSLVLMEPKYKNAKYRASIQVVGRVGGQVMNSISAKKMADYIAQNFPGRNSLLTGYKLLNYAPVNLADGRKGYIYYTEFTVDDTRLMQMHLYISSSKKNFLITYTDLPQYFGGDFTSEKLQKVWNSFQTIELDSATPVLFYENNKFLSLSIGLIIVFCLFYFSRKFIFTSRLKKFSSNPSSLEADLEMIEEDSFKTYKDTDEEEQEALKASESIKDDDDNFFSNAG